MAPALLWPRPAANRPLWAGARYSEHQRVRAIQRGFMFVHQVATDQRYFSDNGDPELTWDNWASVVLSNALIFCPYNAFAVDTFKPANGEMTSSHLLKMLDKRVVHGSAA